VTVHGRSKDRLAVGAFSRLLVPCEAVDASGVTGMETDEAGACNALTGVKARRWRLRRDTGFLAFLFPRSLGSGVYDEINGG